MAIWELTHSMSVYGQVCQNKYQLVTLSSGDAGIGAVEVNDGFEAAIYPTIIAAMSNDVTAHTIYCRNLYDPEDFNERSLAGAGAIDSDAMPSFVAVPIRSARGSTAIRRGYKRYVGVPETSVTNGALTDPAQIRYNAIRDDLEAPLVVFNGGDPVTLRFAVLGRQLYYPDPVGSPTKTAYRYYPTEAEQREHMFLPISWEVRSLTTQRTRKIGAGI